MRRTDHETAHLEDAKPDNWRAERRQFVKRAAYVAPAIATVSVAPAFAKPGSEKTTGPKHDKPQH